MDAGLKLFDLIMNVLCRVSTTNKISRLYQLIQDNEISKMTNQEYLCLVNGSFSLTYNDI